MRFIHLYLVGYFVLVVGAVLALWQAGVLARISGVWITIGLIVLLFALLAGGLWIGLALLGVAWIGMQLFTSRPDLFYRGLTEKLMTYALGRGLGPSDSPTIDRITDDLAANHGKFSILLLDLVTSPQFQLRRGDDGAPVEPPQKKEPAALNVGKRP